MVERMDAQRNIGWMIRLCRKSWTKMSPTFSAWDLVSIALHVLHAPCFARDCGFLPAYVYRCHPSDGRGETDLLSLDAGARSQAVTRQRIPERRYFIAIRSIPVPTGKFLLPLFRR